MYVVQGFGFGGTVSFPGNKGEYVNDAYAGSSTVYAIVTIIAETFASPPRVMYKVKSKKALQRYKLLSKSYSPNNIALYRAKNEALDEVEGHPLLDLLDNPNPMQGSYDFMLHVCASRDVTGDTFLWVNRGLTKGDPLQLRVLPAQFMNMNASGPYAVDSYTLNFGRPQTFTPDEVIHWKHANLRYDAVGQHLFGQSPLEAASRDYTLSASIEGKKAAAKSFKNQGAGGLLSRQDEIPWSPEQRSQLIDYLDEYVNGNDNRGKIRPLNSKVNWVQMAMSAADMKLIEGLQAAKEELCNVYNFPVHLLSATSATDNNYAHAQKQLVTRTCYSRWMSFRDFVNARLLPMYKDGSQYHFDYDLSQLPELQEDRKLMVETLSKERITTNEFRMMLGWEKSTEPGAEKILVPTGLTPLDQLTTEPAPPIEDDVNELERQGIKDYK